MEDENVDSDLYDRFDDWSDGGESLREPERILDDEHVSVFRPTRRPPMAVLMAFDDGSKSGEFIRIRDSQFTIGSKSADLTIPHDPMIEPAHLLIQREQAGGTYEWSIVDQSAQAGLYVRARRARLSDGSEFWAGNSRYRYSNAIGDHGSQSLNQRLERGSIPGTSVFDSSIAYPFISRLENEDERIWLISGEYWIGRHSDCALRVADDEFLAPKHVLIREHKNQWEAVTDHVRNGFWIRLSKIRVHATCTFQIGEQRFRLYTNFSRRS